MKLNHGLHLAYCTNVHRGETWAETLDSLETHARAVRGRVCPNAPFGLGLRLSRRAANELRDRKRPARLPALARPEPVLRFHDQRISLRTVSRRRASRSRFIGPTGPRRSGSPTRICCSTSWRNCCPRAIEGSVSTLPGSFKEFLRLPEEAQAIRNNLWQCLERLERVCGKTGHKMHLGLEPEPLCLLETSGETVEFFERFRVRAPRRPAFVRIVGSELRYVPFRR